MKMDAFIAQLVASREITMKELTERLGYRSKTSITRIAKGKANLRSMEEFDRRVRDALNPTPAEGECLERLLESARWKNDYYASQEMRAFFSGGRLYGEEGFRLSFSEDGLPVDLLRRYEGAEKMEITILNSQYVPVFEILQTLIRREHARVRHYFHVNENAAKTIRAVNAMLTVFYEANYEAFEYRADDVERAVWHQGVSEADLMRVAYISGDGTAAEDLIVFDRPDHGIISAGAPGTFHAMLQIDFGRYKSVKRTYFERDALEDYIQYSRDYAALEYNRPVYKIKPDVGVDGIPADLMGDAVREGPWAADEAQRPIMEAILPELIDIYDRRVRNTYQKRKPAHTIMKRRAMWKFACTGRTTDHFWGMRPYTPAERARIFRLLLKEYEHNPFFHLYFLKDDDFLRDAEIAYYEGVGMLILESGTDYNLAQGHSEILITHSEFLRLYKDYFLKNLIRSQVISEEQTRDFLRACIARCEALGKAEGQFTENHFVRRPEWLKVKANDEGR